MKLYYSPGACSLSPHIVLREAGLPFELEKMLSLATHKLEHGADFAAINPKNYVPVLELDDGEVLTEGPAIVQYLGDLVPEKGLVPPNGTMARYRQQEWLNFITSELHKQFSPLFAPHTPDETKKVQLEKLTTRIAYVAQRLETHDFLMGAQFTAADAYLFTVLRWTRRTGPDLSPWPSVVAFMERVGGRPAVQAAIAAEGLKR